MAGSCVYTFISGVLLTCVISSWAMACTGIFRNIEGDMPSDFNVLEGGPFGITCNISIGNVTVANSTFEVNGNFLEFKFNNHVIPEDRIIRGRSSITYRKSVMTMADEGAYYCNLRFPTQLFHICATQVGVGTLPPPVENFRCVAYYFKSLNCSWELPSTSITTHYTLGEMFAPAGSIPGFYRYCPEVSDDKMSCSWALNSKAPFRKETRDFKLIMTGNNTLGVSKWNYTYNHFAILKVSEPNKFDCSAVTTRSATLSWNDPEEVRELPSLQVVHRILYRSEYEHEWKVLETVNNTKMIQNLHPFTNYTFLLASRSSNTALSDPWSNNVTLVQMTLPDVPERAPAISPSGYMVQNFKSKRSVILNFESLSREYWAGATLNYVIQCCEVNVPRTCFNKTSEDPTVTVDGLQQNVSYEFKIWAQNENGVSKSHSTIQIDRYDELLGAPENIEVTALTPKEYRVSWRAPSEFVEDDLTYTVFWCPRMVPRSNACNDTLRWLTTNNTSEKLELEPDHIYQFGVAANSSDRASGMVWTTCIIPVSRELEKITQVTLEKDGPHSLLMRWQVECGVQKLLIDGYQIELCEVTSEFRKSALHDSSGCQQAHYKPSECHIYNVSDPVVEDSILDGLKPRTTYRGAIRIFSKGSFTVDSPVQCAVTDAIGPVVSMIVGIAVGGALGLTLLVFVLYRMAVWVKKKSDMIKEMKVQLPDALHSSEENQMQSYKNNQNGVVRKASDANGSPRSIYGRSFGTDGGVNKQRHNSGHSEGSSSSTDELLYKNIRRGDALGRNPSGDSSGGSCQGHDSLTSVGTQRTQASSCDSGAESDAAAPPSPDSVFGSHTPLARVRPLPKLDEDEDRDSQDSGLDAGPSQQAYSKLGVVPEPPNPLASQLLANSEPSLFDVDSAEVAAVEPAPEVASYSKFGLAKSAGNISGMDRHSAPFSVSQSQPPTQDTPSAMPYSRLGLRHQRPGGGKPFGGTDVTVGVMLEQPHVLPHIKDVAAPLTSKPPTGYVAVGQAVKSPVVPESGQGYSKFSIQPAPQVSSATSGYVPLEAVVIGSGRPPLAPVVQQELPETAKSLKSDSDESPESVSTSDDAAIAGGENSNASLEDFSFSSLSAPSNEETLSEQPVADGVQSPSLQPSSSGYVSASSLPTSDHRSEPPGQPPVQCAPPTMNGYVPALSVPKDSHPVVNGVRDEYVSHNAAFEWARSPSSDQCQPWTAGVSEGKPCAATNGYVALSAVTEPPSARTPSIAVHVNAGSSPSSQHVDCSV
ncbi:uncharacterized protein LOC135391209 [Ornithodoros turicata]|uniref:uncharacterized protein LOC135391209 n=1 Tax=Ornithodoros turicata TaxID=34597 RepID=UPI0031390362